MMRSAFTRLTAIAAPLPIINVDTDKILASRFLKTISRTGLGNHLFSDLRYEPDGSERPSFVLNREPWRRAGIIVALDNFGCGSSREHAPWALADFGIRALMAPSFGDIFYNNCFKNSILPIALDHEAISLLMDEAGHEDTACLCIDLAMQNIRHADGHFTHFEIAPDRKFDLLNGLDEIDTSLGKEEAISDWERVTGLLVPSIPIDISSLVDVEAYAGGRRLIHHDRNSEMQTMPADSA